MHISCRNQTLHIHYIRNCKRVLFLGKIEGMSPFAIQGQSDDESSNVCPIFGQFGCKRERICGNSANVQNEHCPENSRHTPCAVRFAFSWAGRSATKDTSCGGLHVGGRHTETQRCWGGSSTATPTYQCACYSNRHRRAKKFLTLDRDLLRGFNAKPYLTAVNLQDGHCDLAVDDDAFAKLAGKKRACSILLALHGRRRRFHDCDLDVRESPLILSEEFFQNLADRLRLVVPAFSSFQDVAYPVLHGVPFQTPYARQATLVFYKKRPRSSEDKRGQFQTASFRPILMKIPHPAEGQLGRISHQEGKLATVPSVGQTFLSAEKSSEHLADKKCLPHYYEKCGRGQLITFVFAPARKNAGGRPFSRD